MDKVKDSKEYHRVKHRLFFVALGFDAALLVLFFFSGASAQLRDTALKFASNRIVIDAVYLAVFAVGIYLLHFPLRWFEDFRWEHHFGLSNQNFLAWLRDDLKKGFLNLLLLVFAGCVIYILLRRFPGTWWVGAGMFWLFLTLFLARITPNVIVPLFFKYSSIDNQELRERILMLFQQTRIAVKDAYLVNFSAKTKKANAFICGLGSSRRVVLSDNLVNAFSIAEIEAVVAHEIGHYKHHDMLKLTVVNSSVVFLGFFFVDKILKTALLHYHIPIDDIASFPAVILGLTILSLLTMPLLSGFSRRLETAADLFSLTLTRKPADFISMIRKLGEMNLADFEPPPFIEILFYTHPPIAKRIRFAERFSLP